MRLLCLLFLTLALAGTTASNARAQTVAGSVTVTVGSPMWANRPTTPDYTNLTDSINRTDCLADDATISFAVSFSGGSTQNKSLEVWSGQDCQTEENRDENDCVMVANASADNATITVSVQDILQNGGDGQEAGTGSDETCDDAGGAEGTADRTLFFLVIDPSNSATPLGQGTWPFHFDVTPPLPPQNVVVGPGEESLIITFEASGDDDLAKYRAYCAEDEGGCTSSVLTPDEDVPEGTGECGSTNSTLVTELTANDLANGTSYAVGLVAEDKFGNRSPLSTIGCNVPQEVTGFFEAYRAAGGQGGGGFCSFAPPRRGALGLFALALLGTALLRRRR